MFACRLIPLQNVSLSSCVDSFPQEQPFTFRNINMYIPFVTNLLCIESNGHFVAFNGPPVRLNYSAHHYWKVCTTSSGCTFVRQCSALPELADLPLVRAGDSGTGVRKSDYGSCWHLESRREFSRALENAELRIILLFTINRRAGVLLCLCVHKQLFLKHYPFLFSLLS